MAKITIEKVREFCEDIGVECLSSEYVGIKDKLEFICPRCNSVYLRSFDNVKNRKNPLCSECGRLLGSKKLALKYDDIKNFVDSNSDCKLISKKYNNVDSQMSFQCVCGELFSTTYYRFKSRGKRQCDTCGRIILKHANATPHKEIEHMVKKNDYKLLKTELLGGDQRMLVGCDKGHTPYWVNVAKFKVGQRCPKCSRSLGEEYLNEELKKLNVDFTQEYTFKDLVGVGGGLLRYDFALFENNSLQCLIEYDGKQHFEVAFGDSQQFQRTQKHDRIKDIYAEKHEIPLYRIPYWKYEEIPIIMESIIGNKYKI